MNQKQLSLFIRHAFSLTNAEKAAVKGADPVFANAMTQIRRLVEGLPEEALLQDKAWKRLRPQVMQALQPYNDSFRESIIDSLEGISKEVEENVVKSLEAIKAPAPIGTSGPIRNAPTGQLQAFGNRILAENVQSALSKTSIANVKLEKLFRVNPELDTPTSLWMKQNFQTIDRTVRTGILQGASTESTAKSISKEMDKRGLLRATKDTATGKIKGQANTVARTAIQSFNRQITEQVWDANADALEGLVYEWTAALDSRVCPTCGPLDGQKKPERGDLPETPIHPNCRCNVVVVDPDEDDDVRTAIQLSETKPTGKGSYASKVRVNGKLFYRKAVEIKPKGATYADYLADMAKKSKDKSLSPADQKSAGVTLAEYFGGAGKVGQGESTLGVERADWFTQAVKKGFPPDDALKRLVTDPDRVTKLRSFKTEWDRGIDPPKPKAPKPKPKPPAPKPKPAIAAKTTADAAAKAKVKPETETKVEKFTPIEKLTNEQMVSELEKKWDIPVPRGLRDERQLLADQLADMRGEERLGSARLAEIDDLIKKNKSFVPVSKPRDVSGNTRLSREFNKSESVLGKGVYGEARLTSKGDVIKSGAIGQDEVEAMQRLERSGISPVLKDAEAHTDLVLGGGREADGASAFIGKYDGMLKMSRAKGVSMETVERTNEVSESFLRSSKKMHLQGVAHNDRHMGNLFVDQKKVSFLDFGLAQTDSRAALIEALGNDDPALDRQGGDLFLTNELDKSSVWKIFRRNKAAVVSKLRTSNKGSKLLRKGIRTSGETLEELISENDAQALLGELYEGI